jgi:uncharacterized protein (TIGR03435 family)
MAVDAKRRLGIAALACVPHLAAQPAPQPRFEVVSIRAVPPNAPLVVRDQDFTPILPGGQYIDSRTTLSWMIGFAYEVKFLDLQLTGLPNWAKTQSFAVAAKASPDLPALSPAQNNEQVRVMMRAMLADRFHLQLHQETRKGSIYNLEVSKGGIKIPEVDAPVPPAKEGHVNAAWSDNDIRMIARKSTMPGLAAVLTLMLDALVVDQTGLKGFYDFDVEWRDPDSIGRQSAGVEFTSAGIGFLISNLQSEFGLHLARTEGPTRIWVVDHVERPTDN